VSSGKYGCSMTIENSWRQQNKKRRHITKAQRLRVAKHLKCAPEKLSDYQVRNVLTQLWASNRRR